MKAMKFGTAAAAAALLVGLAGMALSQEEAPTGTPPPWATASGLGA